MSLAEKFQITIPAKDEDGEGWADVSTTRLHMGVPSPELGGKGAYLGARFNRMPVGYDASSELDKFVPGFGGDTDVTGGVDEKSLGQGFKKLEMKATDDQYTGEHVDLFYGDSGGFAERNNYLDRE